MWRIGLRTPGDIPKLCGRSHSGIAQPAAHPGQPTCSLRDGWTRHSSPGGAHTDLRGHTRLQDVSQASTVHAVLLQKRSVFEIFFGNDWFCLNQNHRLPICIILSCCVFPTVLPACRHSEIAKTGLLGGYKNSTWFSFNNFTSNIKTCRMSDWCQQNCLAYPPHCPPSICTCLDQCRYRTVYCIYV